MTFTAALYEVNSKRSRKLTRPCYSKGYVSVDNDGNIITNIPNIKIDDLLADDWRVACKLFDFETIVKMLETGKAKYVRRDCWITSIVMYLDGAELVIEDNQIHKLFNLSVKDATATDWEVVK